MGKRNFRRFFQAAAALLLTVAMLLPGGGTGTAQAVTQADIDALKSDASTLNSKKKELQSQLSALQNDKTAALQKKALLDQQAENLQSQITNLQTQISTYSDLITQTEAELLDAQEQEAAQYELFCKRVRAMEERGTVSYWSVLFKANSFTDLLSRLDFINEIMESDQSVIDRLQALQEEIQSKQDSLEEQKAGAESSKAELVSKKSELEEQRAAADKLVKEIQANEADYKDTIASIAAEEASVLAEANRLSRELAKKQAEEAARNGTSAPSNAALGGYIWPVSSRKINSPFGSRNTGIKGASTNHKGVDIGGVGYTTQVHAAKAGTVIISTKSSSYGNYVVVSHGSGNTTLYAHMSSRSVSVGQYVNQGDVLGVTGSTGISSGPHLHFEITENGSRVNPLTYLTGYIKNW